MEVSWNFQAEGLETRVFPFYPLIMLETVHELASPATGILFPGPTCQWRRLELGSSPGVAVDMSHTGKFDIYVRPFAISAIHLHRLLCSVKATGGLSGTSGQYSAGRVRT